MRTLGADVTAVVSDGGDSGFIEAAIDAERSLYETLLGIGPCFESDFASSAGLLVVGLWSMYHLRGGLRRRKY